MKLFIFCIHLEVWGIVNPVFKCSIVRCIYGERFFFRPPFSFIRSPPPPARPPHLRHGTLPPKAYWKMHSNLLHPFDEIKEKIKLKISENYANRTTFHLKFSASRNFEKIEIKMKANFILVEKKQKTTKKYNDLRVIFKEKFSFFGGGKSLKFWPKINEIVYFLHPFGSLGNS